MPRSSPQQQPRHSARPRHGDRPVTARGLLFALLALLGPAPAAGALELRLEVGSIHGEGWRAEGITAHYDGGALRLRAQSLHGEQLPLSLAQLALDCPPPDAAAGTLRCDDGLLRARLHGAPPGGAAAAGEGRAASSGGPPAALEARLRLTPGDAEAVRLSSLRAGPLQLRTLTLRREREGLRLQLQEGRIDLAGLGPWLPLAGLPGLAAFTAAGALMLSAEAQWRGDGLQALQARLRGDDIAFSNADGSHAAEGLALALQATLKRQTPGWQLQARLAVPHGQHYRDPVYNDFATAPVTADLTADGEAFRRLQLHLHQEGVLTLTGEGQRDEDGGLRRLRLQLTRGALAPLATRYVQPWLAGSGFGPVQAAGVLRGEALWQNDALRQLRLQFDDADLALQGRDLAVEALSGALQWQSAAAAEAGAASRLQWQRLHLGRLPLGAAELTLRLAGDEVALLAPVRVPLLGGSLDLQRLQLAGIGGDALSAGLAATISEVDLAQLSAAMDWPSFEGRLSGRLPGLRLDRGDVLLEGALTAEVFDGRLEMHALRVLDAFGPLPRLAADLRLRRLDLEALTTAFSFGTITGRLDGEVLGLRLLGGEPVAFDAQLYSTPGQRGRRRISQRAIDNISAAGGGPRDVVSRGLLSVFSDFPYRRIGWRCRLRDGICAMGGVRPREEGGYFLVEGRGLPRIAVIGHGRRVDWQAFVSQLRAATAAGRVETGSAGGN